MANERPQNKSVRFQTGDGRVVIVRIRYSANTVIVVPVPPKPRGPDHTYLIRPAGRNHNISVDIDIEPLRS